MVKQWVLSELRAAAAPTELARFALDMSNQRVTLIERTLGGRRTRGEAVHGTPDFDDDIHALLSRVARRSGREAPVDLLLPPELTLSRVETFPAEARRNLRDEVWWRLESITPYQPEELCYDVAIVGVEPQTGFLDVNVAIAPRDIVEEALSYARDWGFAPQRVSSAQEVEGFPHGPVFIEAANQRRETRSLKRAAAALTAVATALAVIGGGRAVMERTKIADKLETEAAQIETDLEAALAVREVTLDLAARAGRPEARRLAQRAPSSWLATLVEAAPPDVVIERLTLADDQVRIEGATANADAALAALVAADAFADPRHAALITAGPAGADGAPLERFAIEARITPPPPPADAAPAQSASVQSVSASGGGAAQ